jgi:hypothetical protein
VTSLSTTLIAVSETPRRGRSLLDADGKPTNDPRRAVSGEYVEYDRRSKLARRTWFRLEQVEIKWLPVSEPAFLLWVLALLLIVWLAIGVALGVFL